VKGLKGAFMGTEGEPTGGLPRSQTQDPSRQGFGFFGNQRNKQGGKMSQADSVPALAEVAGDGMLSNLPTSILVYANKFQLCSVLISRPGWSTRRASFRPLSPGVFRKLNFEVCLVYTYLDANFLTKFIRYGHGGHLPQVWCRFRYSNHS
jgi:hypothetical protein